MASEAAMTRGYIRRDFGVEGLKVFDAAQTKTLVAAISAVDTISDVAMPLKKLAKTGLKKVIMKVITKQCFVKGTFVHTKDGLK